MKKNIFAAAAIAALILAAVPAQATHNLGAGYTLEYIVSNFNGSTTTGDGYYPEGVEKDAPNADFFQQRVRLSYTGEASEDLKLVAKFEFDYIYWGDDSYGVSRNRGGALGSDEVNIETKHLYLAFRVPGTPVRATIGMQPYTDAFKGIIIDADAAALAFSAPFGGFTGSLAFFRLFDDGDIPGDETMDMLALDASYAIGEGISAGGSYYLMLDDRDGADYTVHTLGVKGAATFGPATIDALAVYQLGDAGDADVSAFAAACGLKVGAGPGTVRAEFLYASGDDDPADDEINALQIAPWESFYYAPRLAILTRDEFAMTTDNAIVYDVNNNGQGAMVAAAGYDLELGKVGLGATAGAAWVAEDPAEHEGKMLGAEVNVKVSYPLYGNLTVVARGAYAMLGSYFDGVAAGGDDPEDPFDFRVILDYSF